MLRCPRMIAVSAQKAFEFLLEPADTPAAVDKMLRAARPGRMGRWIDIQTQRVAFRPVSGAGLEFGTISHHNRDLVVVWVDFFFHSRSLFVSHDPALDDWIFILMENFSTLYSSPGYKLTSVAFPLLATPLS